MGRWSYSGRMTVEECNSISIKFFTKHHYFDGGTRWGSLNWTRGGSNAGSIGFYVSTVKGDEYIRLQYTNTSLNGEKSEMDYKVPLVFTSCNYGGRRWWFICPLSINGRDCARRVGVLYSSRTKYFGCRHCHNLTYESSKESHKFDRLYKMMGVTAKQAKKILK